MDSISDGEGNLCGITIFWRIENFRCKVDDKLLLWSPVFEIETLDAMWQMKLFRENIGLSCYFGEKTCSERLSPRFTMILLTGFGWSIVKVNEPCISNNERWSFECSNFITDENLKNKEWFYLPSGALTVGFNIWNHKLERESCQTLIISKLLNKDGNRLHHRPTEYFYTLKLADLLCFLDSHKFQIKENQRTKNTKTQQTQTDEDNNRRQLKFVTIRTVNREFVVSKSVLSAKSPVFNEMFEKEGDRNAFDIDDVDCDTMSLLINYLHFDYVGDITWDASEKLLDASFKYQIDPLKSVCVKVFKNKLSIDNVCKVFVMSEEQELKHLMCCAQEYFCNNAKVILQSKSWRNLMNSHTELAADILQQFAKTM